MPSVLLVLPLCPNCVQNIRVFEQVFRRQVGVTLNHLGIFPAPHFFQNGHRHAALDQPACPCMAQIVPAEVFDSGLLQTLFPNLAADILQLSAVRLYKHIADTARFHRQYLHGGLVKRHGYGLSAFGLVGFYPCGTAVQVDLLPFQIQHIALPQAGGQREGSQVVQQRITVGQYVQQPLRFFGFEPADTLFRFTV